MFASCGIRLVKINRCYVGPLDVDIMASHNFLLQGAPKVLCILYLLIIASAPHRCWILSGSTMEGPTDVLPLR